MALGNKRRTVKGSDVLDGTRRRENLEFLGRDLQQFLSAFNKKLVTLGAVVEMQYRLMLPVDNKVLTDWVILNITDVPIILTFALCFSMAGRPKKHQQAMRQSRAQHQ